MYFQHLADEMNMLYVNFFWKYSQQFSNVITHLGDFYVMKENFKLMELLVQCSGFEERV